MKTYIYIYESELRLVKASSPAEAQQIIETLENDPYFLFSVMPADHRTHSATLPNVLIKL